MVILDLFALILSLSAGGLRLEFVLLFDEHQLIVQFALLDLEDLLGPDLHQLPLALLQLDPDVLIQLRLAFSEFGLVTQDRIVIVDEFVLQVVKEMLELPEYLLEPGLQLILGDVL